MNGLDVGAAIIAVSTAFHAGADSMREIKKRRPRKKKGEQVAMEKLVLDTLETAESQISSRYAAHLEELGQQFQFGDGKPALMIT